MNQALLTPIRVGRLLLPNRLAMAPMRQPLTCVGGCDWSWYSRSGLDSRTPLISRAFSHLLTILSDFDQLEKNKL